MGNLGMNKRLVSSVSAILMGLALSGCSNQTPSEEAAGPVELVTKACDEFNGLSFDNRDVTASSLSFLESNYVLKALQATESEPDNSELAYLDSLFEEIIVIYRDPELRSEYDFKRTEILLSCERYLKDKQ